MFERPKSGERALLLHIGIGGKPGPDDVEEFAELSRSAGAVVLEQITVTIVRAQARFLIGSGKVRELAERVRETDAELLLVAAALTPSQERNLESQLHCRVLDRSAVILDIFAQRARSFEGKLEVELAQLTHISTRLIRGWTHLERQKGGIGLRGPGESQLETDRRLLARRIRRLRQRLVRVDKQRCLGRAQRIKADVPVVALAGYTNTGKSTLFNRLTSAGVVAADRLFATLDPTLRKLTLGDGSDLVLADTVGFVRDLPHELVAAFRSTLTETRDASLILHVIDSADPHRRERIQDVNAVLTILGARDIPQLKVYNKIDVSERSPRLERDDDGIAQAVWLSSLSGAGVELLQQALIERFQTRRARGELRLDAAQGRQRALLFRMGAVVAEYPCPDGGWALDVDLPALDFERFCQHENILPGSFSRAEASPAPKQEAALALTDS